MTLTETLNPNFTTQNPKDCIIPIDYSSSTGRTELEKIYNYDLYLTMSCLRTLKCENYDSIVDYMNGILKLFESITIYEQYYLPFWWGEECDIDLLEQMNKIHIVQFSIIDRNLIYSLEELLRNLLINYLEGTRNLWHKYLKYIIDSADLV